MNLTYSGNRLNIPTIIVVQNLINYQKGTWIQEKKNNLNFEFCNVGVFERKT